ncbi:hypothetical protein ACKKBF_B10995 [Auxenochlorella protothecoides x Auxenochlorella symbiontica]
MTIDPQTYTYNGNLCCICMLHTAPPPPPGAVAASPPPPSTDSPSPTPVGDAPPPPPGAPATTSSKKAAIIGGVVGGILGLIILLLLGFAVCRHRKVHKREETQAEMMAHRWRLEREFVNERKRGKTAGGAVTREALEKARQARMAGATPPPAAPPTGYGLGAAGRPTSQAATPMTATPGSVSRGPAVTPSSIAPSSAEPQRSGSARGLFSSRSARSTPSPSVAGPPTYTASFPSPSTDNLPVDADTGVELMPDKSYSSGGPPSGGSWSKKGLGGLFSKK